MLFGIIQHGPDKWEGTKIHVKHGVIRPGKFVVPYGLLNFLKERATSSLTATRSISDVQFEKIDDAFRENIENAGTSDQVRAMMADAKMFGMDAVIRRKRS